MPEKSFWAELNFEWDSKEKWHYVKTKDSGNEITMLDTDGYPNILKKK